MREHHASKDFGIHTCQRGGGDADETDLITSLGTLCGVRLMLRSQGGSKHSALKVGSVGIDELKT